MDETSPETKVMPTARTERRWPASAIAGVWTGLGLVVICAWLVGYGLGLLGWGR